MLNKSHNAETSGAISTDASRAAVCVVRMAARGHPVWFDQMKLLGGELMIARSVCRALGLATAT